MSISRTLLLIAAGGFVFSAQTALAHDAGDKLIRVGITTVDPKSNNNPTVDVDSGTTLTFNGTWFYSENWGIELLAALPFSHDIELKDGTKVGETDHLPPTLSLQYHFITDGKFQPYVGAGVNMTIFFDEDLSGPLAGSGLDLETSFGLAAQVGVDIELNDKWLLNLDVRWIDISTEAEVNGTSIGDVDIDPLVYGINIGYRF